MEKFENNRENIVNDVTFHVLIAAAGGGERFGGEIPKQYQRIQQKFVLRHSVETFLRIPGLQSLRVIIDPSHAEWYHEAVAGLDLPDFVAGDKQRNLSIFNGLKSFSNLKNEDIILIHDAARTLVRAEDIISLLKVLKSQKAASLAVPVADTLRRAENGLAGDYVQRDNLWAMQTPQGFHYDVIKQAHEQADPDKNYTDDTRLVSDMGVPVKMVPGHKSNIKITTKDDLELAEALMSKQEIRTGMGFDVHAFETREDSNGTVRLCGVDIPYERSLSGHSDADVGLHAITDAILGSISAGDIGAHFPPSNDNYKDMDSAVFLKHAIDMLAEKGGKVINLDLTLICEDPKIGPHREAMTERIAAITGMDAERISVKATTSEKLGFTGRGEGIAAQAIATVSLSDE